MRLKQPSHCFSPAYIWHLIYVFKHSNSNFHMSICLFRFTYTKAYKNLLNELGDQAGQHEVIAENLSTQVVFELATLVKVLKDDRRKVNKCD